MDIKKIEEPQSQKPKGAIRKFVVVAMIIIFLVFVFRSCSRYVTRENYNKIQTGMTYRQVVNILDGNEGVLESSTSVGGYIIEYYSWDESSGCSTSCIVVGFYNGLVAAKSAKGL